MAEHGAVRDEAAAVAEIGELLRRHGLRASAEQIQRLVRPRQLLIEGMTELRQVLDAGLEPAPTFDCAEAAAPGEAPVVAEVEITRISVAELSRAYAAGELSPVEVTEAHLARIEALDGRLHAFITRTFDLARQQAQAAESRLAAGQARGLLDGVPIALKDLYDTAGIRTTCHSPLYAERVPGADATTTRLLAEAGTVLLGKLSMHEFASGSPELGSIFPPARNPWNTDLIPGGSSSGSGAAVAAGLAAAALGSDTGGSIRGPASLCGIVGLKPTYGLVSRAGVVPLSWTLDHAGPMTRTVEDTALLLQVLAGHDPADPASARVEIPDYSAALSRGIKGLRIGAPIAYVESALDLDPETLAAYRESLKAFEQLGATVESIELPELHLSAVVGWVISTVEALAFHERDAQERPELYGPAFYSRLLQGVLPSATDYAQALRGRSLVCQGVGRAMERFDLLALPSTVKPAWSFDTELNAPSWVRTSFTRPFNVTGQPAISLPCGFTDDGRPVGLQLVGRPFDESTVLAAAQAYELANDWVKRRPTL